MDLNQENIQKIVAQVLSEMKGTSSQPAQAAAPAQFEIPKKARVAMLTALRKIEIKEFDIPEISDDEARTITVLAIRMEDEQEAQDVCLQAKEEGADFEALADAYSEDTVVSYSFGKGEMEEPIETAAFDLGKDEVSDVITAQDGYYILKCVSTFDEAQTQLNKEKIANQRRNEAFNQEYDSFVNSLVRRLNEELWNSVTMIHDENVTTDSFFAVYSKYFQTA